MARPQGTRSDERISDQAPLQAELLTSLDAARSSRDTPVLAKVLQGWRGPGCELRPGATLAGTASDGTVDRVAKTASLTVRFTLADCEGKPGATYTLRLYALVVRPADTAEHVYVDQGGLFGSFSPRPAAAMGGGSTDAVHRVDLSTDMTVTSLPTGPKLPRVIRAGDVFGVKRLTLETGPQNAAAALRTSGSKSLHVDAGATLILMPFREALHMPLTAGSNVADPSEKPETATRRTGAIQQSLPVSVDPAPVDLTAACAKSCVTETALPARDGTIGTAARLSMAALGYSRKDQRELHRFGHGFSLLYLDRTHLLFTFDLHSMRRRITDGPQAQYVHTVRAVLVDSQAHAILKVTDWQVVGEGQYIWPGPPGSVLAHIGGELVLLGPDLAPRERFALSEPLAWVSTSPSSAVIAVGMLRERHTFEVHRQLSEVSLTEPEEDVDVVLLRSDFTVLGTAKQPSSIGPPVLTRQGELRIYPEKHGQWTLEEFTWATKRKSIATVSSDCVPQVSLPTQGLIFLTGCAQGQSWYRAIRFDGHTVLKGEASSQQFEVAAEGDEEDDAFAVRVVRSAIAVNLAGRIHSSNLVGEQVSVYRAEDGKRLLRSYVKAVPLAEQSFAVAPGSHELAVLGLDDVSIYEPAAN